MIEYWGCLMVEGGGVHIRGEGITQSDPIAQLVPGSRHPPPSAPAREIPWCHTSSSCEGRCLKKQMEPIRSCQEYLKTRPRSLRRLPASNKLPTLGFRWIEGFRVDPCARESSLQMSRPGDGPLNSLGAQRNRPKTGLRGGVWGESGL